MLAVELALHTLAAHAIQARYWKSLPVPGILEAVVEACTYHDLI